MCSITCEMPVSLSSSSKYPALTQRLIATTGEEWSSPTRTVKALGRISLATLIFGVTPSPRNDLKAGAQHAPGQGDFRCGPAAGFAAPLGEAEGAGDAAAPASGVGPEEEVARVLFS